MVCPPLGDTVCKCHVQFPVPDTSEVEVGFWPFCILLFIICPNCSCMWLILVPYSFCVFYRSRRHLSRCGHCSKGFKVPETSLSQERFRVHRNNGEGGSKHLQEGMAVGRRQKAVKVNEEEMQQHVLMVYM